MAEFFHSSLFCVNPILVYTKTQTVATHRSQDWCLLVCASVCLIVWTCYTRRPGNHALDFSPCSYFFFFPFYPHPKPGCLYKINNMDNQGQTTNGSNIVPSTPAFPVSPPTPYGEWSCEDGVKTLECICILWASAFSSQWITTLSFLSSGHGETNTAGHKVSLCVCDRYYACASKLSRTRLLHNRVSLNVLQA